MGKTVLLASAAALAWVTAAEAGPARPSATISGHAASHLVFRSEPGVKTLYDQNGNDSDTASSSQNFESSYDQYDDQGADDFTIPKGHKWRIKEVDVTGQYRFTGSVADTANVFFYRDGGGLPGVLVAECDNVKTADPGTGDFAMKLPKKTCKVELNGGNTYWVSVQANLDYSSPAEQWYWETNTTPQGAAAAWQDPNGGWTTLGAPADCNVWKTLSYCLSGSGDWMFALKGKDMR